MAKCEPEKIGEGHWDLGEGWTLSIHAEDVEIDQREGFTFSWSQGPAPLARAMRTALSVPHAPQLIGERKEVEVQRCGGELVIRTPFAALSVCLPRARAIELLLRQPLAGRTQ